MAVLGRAALQDPLCKLSKLVLCDNKFGPSGAIALFLALKRNVRLESLDVSANRIGPGESMAVFK